jgi:hypothetical protein
MKKPKVKEERFLSTSKIAEIMDVDVATIRRWWKKENAPVHTFGDMIRFKLSEMLEWRSNRVRKTTEKPAKAAEGAGQ